ncbi:MAG: hypothetical protein JWN34_4066 [Bryobacterales bacterium]|nr:hypothetical protein [Bryobacterales bacterium]
MNKVAAVILSFFALYSALSQGREGIAMFEVASVKPSAPEVLGMMTRYLPDGSVYISGATLKSLVAVAYGVRSFQISGGPEWLDTERFDVDARASTSDGTTPIDPSKLSVEQRKTGERLRNLLATRFEVVIRRETKEQPVYELVVTKGGPKLLESTEGKNQIRRGLGTIKGQSVGLSMLALNLSNELEYRVVDKTGLTGKYDFELNWTPIVLRGATVPPEPQDGPSIFTALPEQLGLRLESRKGPVEVLVIDKARRPSGN